MIIWTISFTVHSHNFIRAPTADVGYVPNAKYLAHIPHQTPFDPIYQTCHISYFLQHATVKSQICHGTERVCGIWFILFLFLSLSSLRQSHLVNPNPLLSNALLFHADADDHFHADADADLSLAMVFLFFFFLGCGLMGSVPTEVGGFGWARLWVSVGVMSLWVCCVGRRWWWRQWRWWVWSLGWLGLWRFWVWFEERTPVGRER